MATLSAKQLSQKLGAIAESWTKDPFRPNIQLQTFLKSLAVHPRLTPQAVEATRALRDNDMQKKVCIFLRTYSSQRTYWRLSIGCHRKCCGQLLPPCIMTD